MNVTIHRDWNSANTSQKMPAVIRSWKKQGMDFPLDVLGVRPCFPLISA